jgi:hypothetical protein
MIEKIKNWFQANPWAIWIGLGGAGIGVLYLIQQNASSQSNSNAAQTDTTGATSLTDATSQGALSGDPSLDFSTGTLGGFSGSPTPVVPIGPSGSVNVSTPTPAPPSATSTSVSNPDGDSTGQVHVPVVTPPVQTPAPVADHKATHIGATPVRVPHPSASAHKPAPKKSTRAGSPNIKAE